MADPGVTAILVAHASGRWLPDALAALAAQTHRPLEFVVVAVGDVDVPDVLPRRRTRRIDVPEGAGFATAVNEAVATVTDDYVLLLHDDAAPDPDVVAALVERAETLAEVDAVGAKLVEWHEPEVLQEVGGSVDRFAVRRSGLEADEVDHGQHDDAEDVLYCSAACLLVRRDVLTEGLDPDAWPFYEDVDLCWRLRARGRRVVVAPRARVRHAAALSRGLRRAGEVAAGALGVRQRLEAGRLRFMLRRYAAVSLAVLLPQYALLMAGTLLGAFARREFWRIRIVLSAWVRVFTDLPHVIEARRREPSPAVHDRELLALGGRGAMTERRYARVAVAEQVFAAWRGIEQGALRLARDPAVWVGVVAVAVVLISLRGLPWGGAFTLGELRPPPRLTEAVRTYLARVRPEGLDPFAPGGPGLLLFGALRSAVLGSAALAEKLALVGPLPLAAAGSVRLGRALGLGDRGRRWLAVVAMVNPVTLVLVREGLFGALLTWAASMWLGAALLPQPVEAPQLRDRLRRWSRWILGWTIIAALHPPAMIWLGAVAAGLIAVRTADGGSRLRLQRCGIGIAGALVLNLPWSISWFTSRSPVLASADAAVSVAGDGVSATTLGAGWFLIAWAVIGLVATAYVGIARGGLIAATLLAGAWLAGSLGVLPAGTALAAIGWSLTVLVILVARRISDELPRYELGRRHAAVIGIVALSAVVWSAAGASAIVNGTDARTLAVVLTERQATGRVLWLADSPGGLRIWATQGFRQQYGDFPSGAGPAVRMVARGVEAARADRTHRLGGVLALADVSHVVALDRAAQRGLGSQADLSPQEEQSGALVLRNDAWVGPAMLLAAIPHDPVSPTGLADAVRESRGLELSTPRPDRWVIEIPGNAEGAVYLAGGLRPGWGIDDGPATIAAAGVALDVEDVNGSVEASAPGWWRILYPLQFGLGIAILLLWAASAYLEGAEPAAADPTPIALRPPGVPRVVLPLPAAVLVVAGVLSWIGGTAAPAGPFLSSAWYCPPVGAGFTQRIAIANPAQTRVEYLVRPALREPPSDGGIVGSRGRVTVEADPEVGGVVETYGRPVAVAAEVARDGRVDSALCARRPLGTNVFPEGGRAATRAVPRLFEAYVISNPFPDLVRASVRFLAPDETIAPPALQDVRVEPGSFTIVDPEDQFEPMLDLSAEITVWQGRAVVARRIRTVAQATEQVTWSLATDLRESGVLPRASTDRTVTAVIAVNPSDEAARVSVFAVGAEGSLPQEAFEVPPNGRTTFDLASIGPDLADLFVRLDANRPVAMESLVVPDDRRTISLLPPVDASAVWTVPLAEGRTLVLTNPGTRSVSVELERLGRGPRIRGVEVGPNRVVMVELEGEEPFGVLVRSSGGPVTAAAVGPRGTIPGVPFG